MLDMEPMIQRQDTTNDLLRAYFDRMQHSIVVPPIMPDMRPAEVEQVTTQRKKPSPKLQKALDYLKANEDQYHLSTHDLGKLIGVSHTLVADAKKIIEGRE